MQNHKPAQISHEAEGSSKERIITACILMTVAIFTLFDLVEDRMEGVGWTHLSMEAVVLILTTSGAFYLWRRTLQGFRGQQRILHGDILAAREDATRWKKETASIVQGLGQAIDTQFNDWKLTEAEKEVGILLLKGLSHKETANLRETSERTVRQQAASLYRKASLDGRAQLSAFFLEDLLLPLNSGEGNKTDA